MDSNCPSVHRKQRFTFTIQIDTRKQKGLCMISVFSPRLSNTRRAVEQRVARVLARSGEQLRKCSPRHRWYSSLGDYYLTNAASRFVVATHQDLEDLARDYGILGEDESISDG